MSVAFNRIPGTLRVPLFYAEVNSGLSYYSGNSKLLLIGQKLSAGTAAADTPVQCSDPLTQFGNGSMLYEMARIARLNAPFADIWALPLADPSGVAQIKSITVAGTIAPGTLTFYVNGKKHQVAVLATDTMTTIASAIAASINAGYVGLDGFGQKHVCSATASAGVVTITASHVGALGSQIAVDKDLVGDEGPLAALLTIASGTAGSGIPSLSNGLANCGATEFDFIAMPYADTTSLDSLKAFLSDIGGRWDPNYQMYGHALAVSFGNLSTQTTLGAGRNDQHMTVMGVADSPDPSWRWAAALGGQVVLHKNLGADLTQAGEISRPMQTLALAGIRGPKLKANQWAPVDRQTLYFSGIAGYAVASDGTVVIDRLVTTYRTNAGGQNDTTWLDIETLCQTVYTVRFLRQQITQKHPRDALIPDNPNNLQGFTTPGELKADVIHAYSLLCRAGIAKNLQLFADSVIVEQAADPNRVNAFIPLDVANQLRVFAANVTTSLNRATV
jgi:phage tail sheath gpL-like